MRAPYVQEIAAVLWMIIASVRPLSDSPPKPPSTEDCSSLQVKNAQYQPYLNGVYTRLGNNKCAGRNVYIQDVRDLNLVYNKQPVHFLYLYHVIQLLWDDQYDKMWVIGRIMCNSRAFAKIAGESPLPEENSARWEESHVTGWEKSNMAVICKKCYTLKVNTVSILGGLDLSGQYDRLPPSWHCNNKSVWRRYVRNITDQIIFLYIYSVSQGSMWVISDMMCDKKGFARMQADAASPELGVAKWEEYQNDEGWVMSPIDLECTTYDIDCITGDWAEWSSCSKTCDSGIQSRNRTVIRYPKGFGDSCDKTIVTRVCVSGITCPEIDTDEHIEGSTIHGLVGQGGYSGHWTPGPREEGWRRTTSTTNLPPYSHRPAARTTSASNIVEMQKNNKCYHCEKCPEQVVGQFQCDGVCFVIVGEMDYRPDCERRCIGIGNSSVPCCSDSFCPYSGMTGESQDLSAGAPTSPVPVLSLIVGLMLTLTCL